MEYVVECACGERLPVTPRLAGSTIHCVCGRDVSIPQLSELRQAAGQEAYEAGILDTIRRMIATGELPPERQCALTGVLTDDVVEMAVECERRWYRDPGKWS